MGDGFTDFYPPPAETRSIIGAGYSCPATLLVQVRAGCAAMACGNVHTCVPTESVDSLMCGPPAAYTVLACHAFSAHRCTPAWLLQLACLRTKAPCHCPLPLQFTDDNTDETPEAEAILRTDWRRTGGTSGTLGSNNGSTTSSSTNGSPGSVGSSSKGPPPRRSGGWGASAGGVRRGVTRVMLPGTHLTPCGTSAPWRLEPGAPFGPAEALAAAGLAALQGDTLRLADRLVHWLDAHS